MQTTIKRIYDDLVRELVSYLGGVCIASISAYLSPPDMISAFWVANSSI